MTNVIDFQKAVIESGIGDLQLTTYKRNWQRLAEIFSKFEKGYDLEISNADGELVYRHCFIDILLKIYLDSLPPESKDNFLTEEKLIEFFNFANIEKDNVRKPHIAYLVRNFLYGTTYEEYISPIEERENPLILRNLKEKVMEFETRKSYQLSFKIFKIMNNHFHIHCKRILNDSELELLEGLKVYQIKELLNKYNIEDIECPASSRYSYENNQLCGFKGNLYIDFNYDSLVYIVFKEAVYTDSNNKTIIKMSVTYNKYDERLSIHTDTTSGNGPITYVSRKYMRSIVKSLQHKKITEIAEYIVSLLDLRKIDN